MVSMPWMSCCQAAAWAWLSVGKAVLPRPTAERPFLLYPNPDSFSLLCSLWRRTQLIRVPSFISIRAFTEQWYISSLGFKALPIPQIKTGLETSCWPRGWEAAQATLHSAWPASPQHLIWRPYAIIIILWEDFFPAKNAWKIWGFSQIHFFSCGRRAAPSFENLRCGVLACGSFCGCKARARVGGRSSGSQPDAITAMLSAGNRPSHVAPPKPCSSRISESLSWHIPKHCLEVC